MLCSESKGHVSSSKATGGVAELYTPISGLKGVVTRAGGMV